MNKDKTNNPIEQDAEQTVAPPSEKELSADNAKQTVDRKNATRKKDDEKDAAGHPKSEGLSFSEVVREQATEDESPLSRNFSLRKILGGDLLNTGFIRRQIPLVLLIVAFIIIYIANRYSCQQDIIEIDKLQTQLRDAKFQALSSTSEMTEKSLESNVLQVLKNNKDSVLKMASQPPYIINVPESESDN